MHGQLQAMIALLILATSVCSVNARMRREAPGPMVIGDIPYSWKDIVMPRLYCTVPSSQMECMSAEVVESFHERCANAPGSPTSTTSTAIQPGLKQLVEYCMCLAATPVC